MVQQEPNCAAHELRPSGQSDHARSPVPILRALVRENRSPPPLEDTSIYPSSSMFGGGLLFDLLLDLIVLYILYILSLICANILLLFYFIFLLLFGRKRKRKKKQRCSVFNNFRYNILLFIPLSFRVYNCRLSVL